MPLERFYRTPGVPAAYRRRLLERLRSAVAPRIRGLDTEVCFYVETRAPLPAAGRATLRWLLAETFEPDGFGPEPFLAGDVLEVGPRMSFTTAWSTNAVSVCRACALTAVTRIERSRRFRIDADPPLEPAERAAVLAAVHDRMTEMPYPEPLASFAASAVPAPVVEVPVLEEGRPALERINRELGLALDDWDLDYYTALFAKTVGRNPTSVECFDIAQSNSEHSRHWFFKGELVIDGVPAPRSLLDLVREPLERNPGNSTIAFRDNSSAIRGYRIRALVPERPGEPSPLVPAEVDYDPLFTAETHNFPSGVAPFPGAETGTGGRIRDGHATGRGSLVIAGTAGYCVGNLRIPGYELPWEPADFRYPASLAAPLEIEIEASNGASDYGNKFGEPVIQGFTRSFGLRLASGERREWLKPIMFSGGVGQMDARHRDKGAPEPGMHVVKVGGPAYRIGMGGGSASSMLQGENASELDFNAVQRGDAEMEQKLNRVIRAAVELGEANPIVGIHDQGAGGNCNVLKEIVHPAGARIEVRAIPVGDDTLSVLEIWGAEYQEQDALLVRPDRWAAFRALCEREKVEAAVVGQVTGDGRIVLHDERDGSTPVDLELEHVLGSMPRKRFELGRVAPELAPLELPRGLTVRDALDRVLRLVSVGSKRFLASKVDRSVTGLVARQPCCGPFQLTVADVAVVAQGYLGTTGVAIAIGEQPLKGLVDPAAMARVTLGEMLTNLVWARVSALADVKCSGNWMWAAKLPGEGARLHDAAAALGEAMIALGIAVDGGKDSLSMAARAPLAAGGSELVKAPGTLVVSGYVTCPDVTLTVTPDLKLPGTGRLLLVDLAPGRARLGGSALAQVHGQVGDAVPDLDDPGLLARAFGAVQELVAAGLVRAGHDRSDGGLVTALVEMALAGGAGIDVALDAPGDPLAALFAEELGLVLEVAPDDERAALDAFRRANVPCARIGATTVERRVRIRQGGEVVLDAGAGELLRAWEETSYRLDRLQADPECIDEEWERLAAREAPPYRLSFTPRATAPAVLAARDRPRVAILREEGSNSDRELGAAFWLAGFEPWDVTMTDLLARRVSLERFRGLAFAGGFSYADVLGSAKGWAGVTRFHPDLVRAFGEFAARPDTFSLGVCNGCQLLALLGWIPWRAEDEARQARFVHNRSGRFESRFATVRIDDSPALLLRGMAGSTLGIWSSHGEGRAHFPDGETLERVRRDGLAPVRFVDDRGEPTERYPDNPNGSPGGIAALCSPDGRHLGIMPHPERTFLTWQWGWMPESWRGTLEASPWLRMFQNARDWCEGAR